MQASKGSQKLRQRASPRLEVQDTQTANYETYISTYKPLHATTTHQHELLPTYSYGCYVGKIWRAARIALTLAQLLSPKIIVSSEN